MTTVPYAVELRFDDDLAAGVRELWWRLSEVGAGGLASEGEPVPHISLAVYDDDVPEEGVFERLERLAPRYAPFPVLFSGFGLFPTEEHVLYLAPVVSPELLRVHAAYHALTVEIRDGCRPYYLPGRWVPHCTLAMLAPLPEVLEGLGHLLAEWRAPAGLIRSVALIRLPHVETVYELELSTGHMR